MARRRAQTEYKRLSGRATALLAQDENLEVDFKESLSIVEPEDFVQYANSPSGGALLVGVKDSSNAKGHQRGQICGCEISDRSKMKLLDKASSCVPPIPIEIFVENLSGKAFYRVEVPSGAHKPYCTKSGGYKIRLDGRKLALHPTQLLQLFLATHAGEFVKRFSAATRGLEHDLGTVTRQLDDVEGRLHDIFNTAGNAESLADEAMNNSDQALGVIEAHASEHERVPEHVETIIHKLGLLLAHFEIEDPHETQLAKAIESLFERVTKRPLKGLAAPTGEALGMGQGSDEPG